MGVLGWVLFVFFATIVALSIFANFRAEAKEKNECHL